MSLKYKITFTLFYKINSSLINISEVYIISLSLSKVSTLKTADYPDVSYYQLIIKINTAGQVDLNSTSTASIITIKH